MSILWVTNLPASYRIGLWKAIAKKSELRIRFLSHGERGRHWELPVDSGLDLGYFDCWHMTRGETNVYIQKPGVLSRETLPTAVVLPTWESPVSWALIRWAKRGGVRIVLFNESTCASSGLLSRTLRPAKRRFFTSVDRVVTPGPAASDLAISLGVSRDCIIEGFNCVDHAYWSESIHERKPGRSGHRFLYVGQLIPRKNVEAAILAFSRVCNPADTFTIVGSGQDLLQLQAIANQLHTREQIRFHPHQRESELRSTYANCDTLVLPSLIEVWGLVVNESLAAGLHAVVSRSAGVAPSVAAMGGVYLAEATVDGLSAAMDLSRREWRGPIRGPEILAKDYSQFAQAFLSACEG